MYPIKLILPNHGVIPGNYNTYSNKAPGSDLLFTENSAFALVLLTYHHSVEPTLRGILRW